MFSVVICSLECETIQFNCALVDFHFVFYVIALCSVLEYDLLIALTGFNHYLFSLLFFFVYRCMRVPACSSSIFWLCFMLAKMAQDLHVLFLSKQKCMDFIYLSYIFV